MNMLATRVFSPDRPIFRWTEETVEILKRRRAEGASCGRIAREFSDRFGFVSRNAIIGKLLRLGVPSPIPPSRPPRIPLPWGEGGPKGRVRALPAPRSHHPEEPRSGPHPEPVEGSKERRWIDPATPEALAAVFVGVTLEGLNERVCRWPSGDPRDPETFRYCGAPLSLPKGPYCAGHHRLSVSRP